MRFRLALLFLPALAALGQPEPCDATRSTTAEIDARKAIAARDYTLAAKRFQEAFDACPGNRDLLLPLAEAWLTARQFDEAIRAAERYLAGDPQAIPARLVLANASLMAQRLPRALAEAEKILSDAPDDPAALKIKGNAAYLLGDFGKAKSTFIRLLDRHADDEDGAYMLGRIYYQEEYIDLAVGQFERVMKLNRGSYKALDNLGLCYQALGNGERATRYFLAAIQLVENGHQDYIWPYINLAELLLKKGDAQHAFDAAAKATNRNPMAARGFYVGAKALDQLEKTELARNWLQRAAALDPGSSETWYLLARVYEKLGQKEQAGEARQKFLALKATEPAKRR